MSGAPTLVSALGAAAVLLAGPCLAAGPPRPAAADVQRLLSSRYGGKWIVEGFGTPTAKSVVAQVRRPYGPFWDLRPDVRGTAYVGQDSAGRLKLNTYRPRGGHGREALEAAWRNPKLQGALRSSVGQAAIRGGLTMAATKGLQAAGLTAGDAVELAPAAVFFWSLYSGQGGKPLETLDRTIGSLLAGRLGRGRGAGRRSSATIRR